MDEQVRDRTPDSEHTDEPTSTVSAREATAALGLNERTTFALTAGDQDRAATIMAEGPAAAQMVTDQRLAKILRSLSLTNLAVLDRVQGSQAVATGRLQEALRLLREVGHNPGIILVLSDLSDISRDEGNFAQASWYYQDALGQIRESTGMRVVIDTIENVATDAAAVGLAEQSARLFGASDALRDQIGYRFRGERHLVACEQALVPIRATLGESAFSGAWAAGRALRVEQAFSEALAPFSTTVTELGVS